MVSKIRERIYLRSFLSHFPDLEVVNDQDEQESPDFLLRDRDGLIGIEVAQLFRSHTESGSPERAEESRRARFLRRLAAAYYASGGEPAYVTMEVHGSPPMEIIPRLVHVLLKIRPGKSWSTKIVGVSEGKYRVMALPGEAGHYSRWFCLTDRIGWVCWISTDDINERIQEKAAKLPRYRSTVERVCLLLVADRTRASGMLRWDPSAARVDPHGFDAIFLHVHPEESYRFV